MRDTSGDADFLSDLDEAEDGEGLRLPVHYRRMGCAVPTHSEGHERDGWVNRGSAAWDLCLVNPTSQKRDVG